MLKKTAGIRRPLFGLSGLSGYLVRRNQAHEPNQPDRPDLSHTCWASKFLRAENRCFAACYAGPHRCGLL